MSGNNEQTAMNAQALMFEEANENYAAHENNNNNDNNDNNDIVENNGDNSDNGDIVEPKTGGGRKTRNRRNYRKNRKNRKSRNRRIMYGGGDPSSLPQGQAFQRMTANLHGGRRMRGGSVPMGYPFTDSTLLQGSDRTDAGVAQQDLFYKESQTSIPSTMRYPQSGGGLAPAPISQADLLLPPALSLQALNPQWRTEAGTNPEIGRMATAEADFRSTNSVPGFAGPVNAYQTQAGGRRRSRKQNRASRKNRKDRKDRKNRKSRKSRNY